MDEIKRSDSRNMDFYAQYLETHGLVPEYKKAILNTHARPVGEHAEGMPVFDTSGIRFSNPESGNRSASQKNSKFTKVAHVTWNNDLPEPKITDLMKAPQLDPQDKPFGGHHPEKKPGECLNDFCQNMAAPGLKLCPECNELSREF